MKLVVLALMLLRPAMALEPLWPAGIPVDAAAWRSAALAEWRAALGGFPKVAPALNPQAPGAAESFPGYTRQKVAYAIEDGVEVDAVLFLPSGKGARVPGVVVFHPTLKAHYAQVAGYDVSVPDYLMGPQLAARGFAVLCPRCFIFDEAVDYKAVVARMKERHPRWLGMTRMAWDGVRALDYLASRAEVDAGRLGVIGHSLGAKEVLYVAALDERVKAAVFSEGGIGREMSNWQDVWYLGPGFAREHHELLALVAPRPFLLLAGGGRNGADSAASGSYVDAVRPLYEKLGARDAVEFFLHGEGHRYPPAARERAEAFFEKHLKPPPR